MAVLRIFQLAAEEREARTGESGSGFAVTLKIQSENSGCYGNHPRELVEGLKAARIGLTSCPERCRVDIQQSVLN